MEHMINSWMVSADIIDLISGIFYLCYNIYLSFLLGGEQVCSYFYNQPQNSNVADCNDYYATSSPQVVYSLYSLNAFYSFFGGVMLFLLQQTLWNSCKKKTLTSV